MRLKSPVTILFAIIFLGLESSAFAAIPRTILKRFDDSQRVHQILKDGMKRMRRLAPEVTGDYESLFEIAYMGKAPKAILNSVKYNSAEGLEEQLIEAGFKIIHFRQSDDGRKIFLVVGSLKQIDLEIPNPALDSLHISFPIPGVSEIDWFKKDYEAWYLDQTGKSLKDNFTAKDIARGSEKKSQNAKSTNSLPQFQGSLDKEKIAVSLRDILQLGTNNITYRGNDDVIVNVQVKKDEAQNPTGIEFRFTQLMSELGMPLNLQFKISKDSQIEKFQASLNSIEVIQKSNSTKQILNVARSEGIRFSIKEINSAQGLSSDIQCFISLENLARGSKAIK